MFISWLFFVLSMDQMFYDIILVIYYTIKYKIHCTPLKQFHSLVIETSWLWPYCMQTSVFLCITFIVLPIYIFLKRINGNIQWFSTLKLLNSSSLSQVCFGNQHIEVQMCPWFSSANILTFEYLEVFKRHSCILYFQVLC